MRINSEPTRRQLIDERDEYKRHMDELVEALRRARIYVDSRANYGHYDLEARENVSRIDAILAKIEGQS